jgi:hypothetical protein
MRKTLFSLSLFAILSQPAVAAFQSGSGLLAQCISRDNTQFALCGAYLKATVDVLEELDSSGNLKGEKYCGLNRASVGQLVEAFVSEAKRNPDKLNQGASGTVLSGFRKAFSCKE